jgi:hypothetical protein
VDIGEVSNNNLVYAREALLKGKLIYTKNLVLFWLFLEKMGANLVLGGNLIRPIADIAIFKE